MSVMKGNSLLYVLCGVAGILVVVILIQNVDFSSGARIKDLEAPESYKRARAAEELANSSSAKALAALARHVQHQDTTVAVSALAAIGRSGKSEYAPKAQQALSDARPEVREAAVVALGKMDGEQDAGQVLQLFTPSQPESVRAAVAQYIGRKQCWDGFPQIIKGLRDPDAGVRAMAYAALKKMIQRDYHFNPYGDAAERERVVQGIERSLVGMRPGTGRPQN